VQQGGTETWWGSWQDPYPAPEVKGPPYGIEEFEGPRDSVIEWANTRPAAERLIFSRHLGDYIPLPEFKGNEGT
jgi:hypothetical protein